MHLGPYRLAAPLEPTVAGPAFRRTGGDGRAVEVRYLDRVRTEPTAKEADFGLARTIRTTGSLGIDQPGRRD